MHEPSSRYVVGAYAASPAHRRWNPVEEEQYLQGLAALPMVGAFELPWMGSLHPHDDEWLLDRLPEQIDAILTDIPFIMPKLAEGGAFGLASRDERQRLEAVEAAARMRDDARRLNDTKGRQVVIAVELHSAPRRDSSGADALSSSLIEIASWDWDGAELLVEHCDAQIEGQEPEKGFLRLGEELTALHDADAGVGLSINWGRSAIELRSADRVAEQIAEAAASGLLRGLMLSGASDHDGVLGRAWLDAHHPFRRSPEHPWGDPASMLTDAHAESAIRAAGDIGWVGVKLGWTDGDGAVQERVRMIEQALSAVAALGVPDVRPASVATS